MELCVNNESFTFFMIEKGLNERSMSYVIQVAPGLDRPNTSKAHRPRKGTGFDHETRYPRLLSSFKEPKCYLVRKHQDRHLFESPAG